MLEELNKIPLRIAPIPYQLEESFTPVELMGKMNLKINQIIENVNQMLDLFNNFDDKVKDAVDEYLGTLKEDVETLKTTVAEHTTSLSTITTQILTILSDISNINTQLATKSIVTVSSSGTSTNEIQYITINGVEYKIIGGGSGGGVNSVNGKSGIVVLYGSDIQVSDTNTNKIDAELLLKCLKDNGVLTGTTNAENIVVSGDLTCDGDTSLKDVVVSDSINIPTPTSDNQATTKKYVDDADNLKVNISDIVDNLTSTDINKPLSANQGKQLQDNKINKADYTEETWTFTLDDGTTVNKTILVKV